MRKDNLLWEVVAVLCILGTMQSPHCSQPCGMHWMMYWILFWEVLESSRTQASEGGQASLPIGQVGPLMGKRLSQPCLQFNNLALDSEKLFNAIKTVFSLIWHGFCSTALIIENELQVLLYSAVTVLNVFW